MSEHTPVRDWVDELPLRVAQQDPVFGKVLILLAASPRRAKEDRGESLDELNVPLMSKSFEMAELLDVAADAVLRLAAT